MEIECGLAAVIQLYERMTLKMSSFILLVKKRNINLPTKNNKVGFMLEVCINLITNLVG